MSTTDTVQQSPQIEALQDALREIYRRVGKAHYALASGDTFDEALGIRTMDDLMEVLSIIEETLPPEAGR